MKTSINVARDIVQKNTQSNFDAVKSGDKPNHAPISIYSAPGIGKSTIVKQVSDMLDVPMVDVRLVAMEAADVQGIPHVQDGEMVFSTPWWFPEPENGDPEYGVLFFDELTNAPRAVQQAAYRVILDREIQNGKKLPDGWVIVAAGNRKEDKTGSSDLPPALANRFAAHLHVEANKDDFLDYAARSGIHHHVQGFIAFKPEVLHQFDPKHNREEAYPTPRSWEFASNHLNLPYSDNELALVLSGCVGEGAANEFMGFRRYYGKLPDFKKIMDGKEEYTVPTKDDPGIVFALVSSLVGYSLDCLVEEENEKLNNLGAVVKQLPNEYLTLFFKQIRSSFEAAKSNGRVPDNVEVTHVFRRSDNLRESFGRVHQFLKR